MTRMLEITIRINIKLAIINTSNAFYGELKYIKFLDITDHFVNHTNVESTIPNNITTKYVRCRTRNPSKIELTI